MTEQVNEMINYQWERVLHVGLGFFIAYAVYLGTALLVGLDFLVAYAVYRNNQSGTALLVATTNEMMNHWKLAILVGIGSLVVSAVYRYLNNVFGSTLLVGLDFLVAYTVYKLYRNNHQPGTALLVATTNEMMNHWKLAILVGIGSLVVSAVYRYLNNVFGSTLLVGLDFLVAYTVYKLYRIAATDGADGAQEEALRAEYYRQEEALRDGVAYAVYLNNQLGTALLVGIGSIVVYALIRNTATDGEDEEYDDKTARSLLTKVDAELYRYAVYRNIMDKIARALLTTEGFDPNDLNQENNRGWTPMNYFSMTGNVKKMIRYLIAHGADCRKADAQGRFPLLWAAAEGHLEMVKLLSRDGGAHEDIRRQTNFGTSPLRIAFINGHVPVDQWLIRNGALASRDGDGDNIIHDATMRKDLSPTPIHGSPVKWDSDKREPVLAWARDAARDAITARDNSPLFVSGTILFPHDILESIAQYMAGTPQQVRMLRQLIERLSAFIAEVPFVPFVEEEEESEDE